MTGEAQAYTVLTTWLEKRADEPGRRMGTEREIAVEVGISRAMLRAALERLEQERRIVRKIGRAGGVFVTDGKIERNLNTVEGVPSMLRRQGLRSETRLIRAEVARPTSTELQALELDADDNVFRIRRLRLADGIPWSLDLSVFTAARFPRLLHEDLTSSLYETLARRYGCVAEKSDETIDVIVDTDSALLLDVPDGSPVMRVIRTTWDPYSKPFEYAVDLFRADRTRIHTRKYGYQIQRPGVLDIPETSHSQTRDRL